jgi:hypothetical protein
MEELRLEREQAARRVRFDEWLDQEAKNERLRQISDELRARVTPRRNWLG